MRTQHSYTINNDLLLINIIFFQSQSECTQECTFVVLNLLKLYQKFQQDIALSILFIYCIFYMKYILCIHVLFYINGILDDLFVYILYTVWHTYNVCLIFFILICHILYTFFNFFFFLFKIPWCSQFILSLYF